MPAESRKHSTGSDAMRSGSAAKRSSTHSQPQNDREAYYAPNGSQQYASGSQYPSYDSQHGRGSQYDQNHHHDSRYDTANSRHDGRYSRNERRASYHDASSNRYAHDSHYRAVDSYRPSQDSQYRSRDSQHSKVAPQGYEATASNQRLARSNSSKRTAGTRSPSPRRKAIKGAQSQAGSIVPTALTQPLSNAYIGDSSQPKQCSSTWNPSEGPTSQDIRDAIKQQGTAPSYASNASRAVDKPDICKMSGRTRKYYKRGEIIALPFHEPNRDPDIDPNDNGLRKTHVGPVYSKRRMVIILWMYQDEMFCLPLYSFGNRGLRSKPGYIKKEYVSLRNSDDEDFENQGIYTEVVANTYVKGLGVNTTVHLSGGFKVACRDDITFTGRLTERSFIHLLKIWTDLMDQARMEPW